MNLLKSPLRRTTAVLAGAFIGLAGAVALAAPASAHHPEVNPLSSCVNADGTWQVKWSITNSEADLEGTISEVTLESPESKIDGVAKDTVLPKSGDGPIEAVESLPASVNEARLTIKAHWVRNDHPINGTKWGVQQKPGEKCAPETPPTKPETPPTKPETPPAAPGEPTPILEEDCTTITIGLDNPKNGEEITLHFKTSKGEERTTVIKPGEKKTETFSATEGFTVTVSAKGLDGGSETIAYEQPEGCDDSGSGGGLPVTGAAAGGIAGGAALLLVAGAGLVLMARRRKVKFTA